MLGSSNGDARGLNPACSAAAKIRKLLQANELSELCSVFLAYGLHTPTVNNNFIPLLKAICYHTIPTVYLVLFYWVGAVPRVFPTCSGYKATTSMTSGKTSTITEYGGQQILHS